MGHNKLWLFGVPFYLIGYMVGLIIVLIDAMWDIEFIRRWNYLVPGEDLTTKVARLQIACGIIQSVAAYALYCNGFGTLCWWVLLGPSLAYCAIQIAFQIFYWLANILIR